MRWMRLIEPLIDRIELAQFSISLSISIPGLSLDDVHARPTFAAVQLLDGAIARLHHCLARSIIIGQGSMALPKSRCNCLCIVRRGHLCDTSCQDRQWLRICDSHLCTPCSAVQMARRGKCSACNPLRLADAIRPSAVRCGPRLRPVREDAPLISNIYKRV